jgi:hypothetical protein
VVEHGLGRQHGCGQPVRRRDAGQPPAAALHPPCCQVFLSVEKNIGSHREMRNFGNFGPNLNKFHFFDRTLVKLSLIKKTTYNKLQTYDTIDVGDAWNAPARRSSAPSYGQFGGK